MYSKLFNFFDKVRSNQMSILNLDQFTYLPLLTLNWSCLQDETQKQYQNLPQGFLLFMVLNLHFKMGIWLPLSARPNKNKLFLKCQISRITDEIHIQQ